MQSTILNMYNKRTNVYGTEIGYEQPSSKIFSIY